MLDTIIYYKQVEEMVVLMVKIVIKIANDSERIESRKENNMLIKEFSNI